MTYASGSATLLVALALSAALTRSGLVRFPRRLLPVADRVGGAVLVASGVSLLAYWLPLLTGSSRPWAGPAGTAGAIWMVRRGRVEPADMDASPGS